MDEKKVKKKKWKIGWKQISKMSVLCIEIEKHNQQWLMVCQGTWFIEKIWSNRRKDDSRTRSCPRESCPLSKSDFGTKQKCAKHRKKKKHWSKMYIVHINLIIESPHDQPPSMRYLLHTHKTHINVEQNLKIKLMNYNMRIFITF